MSFHAEVVDCLFHQLLVCEAFIAHVTTSHANSYVVKMRCTIVPSHNERFQVYRAEETSVSSCILDTFYQQLCTLMKILEVGIIFECHTVDHLELC